MTNQNNSRNYYISNENMSDIKESIEEYSMNFDKESGAHGNSRSEIAEMISGSHQITQSRPAMKSKVSIQQPPPIKQETGAQEEPAAMAEQPDKPVFLGEKVFKIIRERYFEVMKITTDDPDVLYDFFLGQKKHLATMKPIKDEDIERQMPSMQRKLIVKREFQKMLTYYTNDVYYSLVREAEKQKMDRQLQGKLEYFNRGAHAQAQKSNRKTGTQIKQIVEKLYNPKGNQTRKEVFLSPEEVKKIQRTKFGKNLSQHFQNSHRQKSAPANIQTVEKLYNFWENMYEREEFGLQWPEETARQTIEQYMYEQIEDLMAYANKKLGFKCGKAISLQKAYEQNLEKLDNIFIPMNSFQEYVKVYNEIERQKEETNLTLIQKAQKKQAQARKKKEVKQFGRPVSATPITILSKPKTHNEPIQQLASKYPKDKLIRTLITEQQLKKPRHALEYGIHDIESQVKIKQWVRIDPKAKGTYDHIISRELVKTFTNMEFSGVHHTDQVMSLLAEENLQKNQVWKQMGPILQEAMLVKAHENPWFRDCILRYLQRVIGQNNKLETNQVILSKLFTHLNSLDQSQKQNQFQKLQTLILTSQNIADKAKKIQQLGLDPNSKAQRQKQRKLLYSMLEEKAAQYVKMRIRKTNEKFTLRNYMKELFQECMKEYKNYVVKNFNVVEGDKECPKLLKYEFFRIVKQINPITLEKDRIQKNHVWVPPKQTPQNFNYKTYNTFSEFYMKDKNVIMAQPEKKEYKDTIWGRKKGKDRENLMMTYDDAKECIFQPRLSRQN